MTQSRLLIVVYACLAFLQTSVHAAVIGFENDEAGWQAAASGSGTVALIDFESITGSTTAPIFGNEFSSFAGEPSFALATQSESAEIFVGNPTTTQIPIPPSGVNMLYPTCDPSCEGIVTLTFGTPVTGVSAIFVDVERDFATTGFSLTPGALLPEVSFTSSQSPFSFLGLISDSPFTTVDIHFATGDNVDGVLIDDLQYSVATVSAVPVPAAVWLFGSGLLGLMGIKRFKDADA
jgi:hypothetical protein